MEFRRFGRSGQTVSEVGLGAWQLGGSDWGDVSDEEALRILSAAVDNGVTFIDTADVYGGGRSERLIGKFLQGRQDLFVATKLGRTSSLWPDQYTRENLQAATEASLERLGVEALDLTQLHCVPPHVLQEGEVFVWLAELQKAGKIKHYGASVETMDEALTCLEHDGLASLQIIFNIFRQKAIDALFDTVQRAGVALIVRLPLASGLLAGKFTAESSFPENDHRNYNRDGQAFNVGETFAGLPFEKGVELADQIKPWVPAGMSMAQMALRWVLDHEAVTVIIPGASRPEQARANAAASDLAPLPADLHHRLALFCEDRVADHIRGPY